MNSSDPTKTWLFRFFGCFLSVSAVFVFVFNLAGSVISVSLWSSTGIMIVGAAVLIAIPLTIHWSRSAKRDTQTGKAIQFTYMTIIRYILASIILIYAAAKVLRTQFTYNLSTLDTPVGELPNTELTWYFFGQSYAFDLVIAGAQFTASVLLFFRRTALLGAVIMLPVMGNIMCLNWFYDLWNDTKIVSTLYFLMTAYIILSYYEKLKTVFLLPDENERAYLRYAGRKKLIFNVGKWIFIVIALVFPYVLLSSVKRTYDYDTPVYGAYEARTVIQNRDTVDMNAPQVGYWKKVYFEKGNWGTVKNNYEGKYWMQYQATTNPDTITITFHGDPTQNFTGTFRKNGDSFILDGLRGKDTVHYTFWRMNLKTQTNQ